MAAAARRALVSERACCDNVALETGLTVTEHWNRVEGRVVWMPKERKR